jgi:hypothetical protein
VTTLSEDLKLLPPHTLKPCGLDAVVLDFYLVSFKNFYLRGVDELALALFPALAVKNEDSKCTARLKDAVLLVYRVDYVFGWVSFCIESELEIVQEPLIRPASRVALPQKFGTPPASCRWYFILT